MIDRARCRPIYLPALPRLQLARTRTVTREEGGMMEGELREATGKSQHMNRAPAHHRRYCGLHLARRRASAFLPCLSWLSNSCKGKKCCPLGCGPPTQPTRTRDNDTLQPSQCLQCVTHANVTATGRDEMAAPPTAPSPSDAPLRPPSPAKRRIPRHLARTRFSIPASTSRPPRNQ